MIPRVTNALATLTLLLVGSCSMLGQGPTTRQVEQAAQVADHISQVTGVVGVVPSPAAPWALLVSAIAGAVGTAAHAWAIAKDRGAKSLDYAPAPAR